MDSNQVLNYLSLNKERFKDKYHLTKIGIFGSIARNDQKDGSDIDLIIEFEDDTPDLFSIKQRLKNEIMEEFNVHVDICREKYIKPVFKTQIMSEVKYV
ncbi:MAG: nucleotidyltransferase domain-containing protein [Proteobacteria bacterium]|nr:nucleotidyltransferase domain-containing protein [Pseudomonadota bacterium]